VTVQQPVAQYVQPVTRDAVRLGTQSHRVAVELVADRKVQEGHALHKLQHHLRVLALRLAHSCDLALVLVRSVRHLLAEGAVHLVHVGHQFAQVLDVAVDLGVVLVYLQAEFGLLEEDGRHLNLV
jgi:hypothetical protein